MMIESGAAKFHQRKFPFNVSEKLKNSWRQTFSVLLLRIVALCGLKSQHERKDEDEEEEEEEVGQYLINFGSLIIYLLFYFPVAGLVGEDLSMMGGGARAF